MAKTNKKQIGFYADDDVARYLDSLDSGVKTKTINEALRQWMKHDPEFEETRSGVRPSLHEFELFADWLSTFNRGPAVILEGHQIPLRAVVLDYIAEAKGHEVPDEDTYIDQYLTGRLKEK